MLNKLPVFVAAALAILSSRANAQADAMAMGRQSAANQIGIMEYCQTNGFADADAVAAQRSAFARLPPAPVGSPPTDSAETLGRTGTLSINGTKHTLASMAGNQNMTVSAVCGQMAANAKQVAASMASMPAMPSGMPSMPGMPAMPGAPVAPK